MWVVSQARDCVANTDMFSTIYVTENRIVGISYGETYVLSRYKTYNRAREVFDDMLKRCFVPPMMVLENMDVPDSMKRLLNDEAVIANTGGEPRVTKFECACYYMPKE